MSTYLLTWNPERWSYKNVQELLKQFASGQTEHKWSCGNTKKIAKGSRVFLIRQGKGETGIWGAGYVTKAPFEEPHFDEEKRNAGKTQLTIMVCFENLFDPMEELKISRTKLDNLDLTIWNSQASGRTIPDKVAKRLEALWSKATGKNNPKDTKTETRTEFVNRVMGLSLGSIQGKYSYCNDERKQVLFSLNISNRKNSNLILSPNWSEKSYAHSLKHIEKILSEGYELFIFKTETRKTSDGETVTVSFEPYIEKRELVKKGKEYFALPIEQTYQDVDDIFKNEVDRSIKLSSEKRLERLNRANPKPAVRTITIKDYVRNPDVVAEVLSQAKGICQKCNNPAPFNRASDGTPYLEVHHKVQLSKGGDDTVENAIALCPNCHRESHFGK